MLSTFPAFQPVMALPAGPRAGLHCLLLLAAAVAVALLENFLMLLHEDFPGLPYIQLGSARHRLCSFPLICHVATPNLEGMDVDGGPGGNRCTSRRFCADSGQYNVPLLLWLDEQQSWPEPVLSYCLPQWPLRWWKVSDRCSPSWCSLFRSHARRSKPLSM